MMYSILRVLKHAWIALLLVPCLAVAKPHHSAADPPLLSNSQEPGSLMVFPYFKAGTVNVSGQDLAKTEIHIGVTCPSGVTCPENEPIKLEGHWVCPGSENPNTSFVCRETNFVLFTTVNGKITLNPNGQSATPTGGYVPVAPCPEGYLIVFAVNMSDQPIKFDGLIGDAVVRLSDGALSAYSGVPVQADPALAVGALITLGRDPLTGGPTLSFDGGPGNYTELTGQLSGDVKFDNTTVSPLYNNTFLILLTLDVRSNFPNYPTFVPVTFNNAKQAPTSTETNFVCWQKVDITRLNASLNQTSQGSAEGSFVSGSAFKVAIQGISDIAGLATLLGLVLTTEGNKPNGVAREYITAPFNNSLGVPTFFTLD
jgi:hypothetical protein